MAIYQRVRTVITWMGLGGELMYAPRRLCVVSVVTAPPWRASVPVIYIAIITVPCGVFTCSLKG